MSYYADLLPDDVFVVGELDMAEHAIFVQREAIAAAAGSVICNEESLILIDAILLPEYYPDGPFFNDPTSAEDACDDALSEFERLHIRRNVLELLTNGRITASYYRDALQLFGFGADELLPFRAQNDRRLLQLLANKAGDLG